MKAEKVILSFVAVLIGLVAAGAAFYLYQMTQTVPSSQNKPITVATNITPIPTPDNGNFLNLDQPADESVSDKQQITVSGTTSKNSTIIISTEDDDDVVTPAGNGSFTTTETIPQGTSLLEVTSVFPDGTEQKIVRTVTFSTEQF